jgi:hypothetical protein
MGKTRELGIELADSKLNPECRIISKEQGTLWKENV